MPNTASDLSAKQVDAVLMVRSGRSRDDVATTTGLTREEVDAAIQHADSVRLARKLPAGLAAPRSAPGVDRPKHLSAEQLIAWAADSGITRAQTLATRATDILAELRELEGQDEKRRTLTQTITVLEQKLADYRGELRQLSGKPGGASSAGPGPKLDRSVSQKIRNWAAQNGHAVSDRGRIPENVLAAYRAANG